MLSAIARHVGAEGASVVADEDVDYNAAEAFLSWNAADAVEAANLQPRWLCGSSASGGDTLLYVRNGIDLVVVDPGCPTEPLIVTAAALAAMLPVDPPPPPSALNLEKVRLCSPTAIILVHDAAAYRCDLASGTVEKMPEVRGLAGTLCATELMSPDGRFALFATDHNLYVRGALPAGKSECLLTTDGVVHAGYGSLTGAAAVTLARKSPPQLSRPAAIWSPDSTCVLTSRVDERQTLEYHLIQSAPETGETRPKLWSYKYSLPGEPVPPVTLHVLHILTGRHVTVATQHLFGDEHDEAGCPVSQNMAWFSPDSSLIRFIAGKRDRTKFALCEADAATGECRTLVEESNTSSFVWLSGTSSGATDTRANTQFLADGDCLWWSERSGWGHIYRVCGSEGSMLALTAGEWVVDAVVGVDETEEWVFFTAVRRETGVNPYYKQLYRTRLDGSTKATPTLLTPPDASTGGLWADHKLSFASPSSSGSPLEPPLLGAEQYLEPPNGADGCLSPSGLFLIDEASTPNMPPILTLRHATTGSVAAVLETAQVSSAMQALLAPHGMPEVVPFSTTAADGVTEIIGVLHRPRNFDPSKNYPVIDTCYPGPQVGRCTHRFMDTFFHKPSGWGGQALAELGFIVVTIDERGTPLRGKAFHSARYGKPDSMSGRLQDHIAAITELATKQGHNYMDLTRVGITGASGGGLQSSRAVLEFPDFFHVAVSFCGNHDNAGYNASWGETYHGLDKDGGTSNYPTASNQHFAANLRGKLLLIHGEMDENVRTTNPVL